MKLLSEVFDHYVINARIKVAFFISLPAVLTFLVWLPQASSWSVTLITLLVTFGCFSFLSNTISNRGNDLQDKLYKQWGGEPTTILLRHRDETIDPYTKARIYSWLQNNTPELQMPTPEQEKANPKDADQRYTSAVHYLREFTRDRKKYSLVYHDLVAYGFARNLLAVKPIGIMIAVVSLVLSLFVISQKYSVPAELLSVLTVFDLKLLQVASVPLVTIGFLVIYTFWVNQKQVRQRADRYARSLLAVCDRKE